MSSTQIKNESSEYPYYTPCFVPLVTRVLQSYDIEIYPSLLANETFGSVPNLKVYNDHCTSYVGDSVEVGDFNIYDKLGIFEKECYSKSFEDGWLKLNSIINKGFPLIVGVTTYHLPYSEDFLKDAYIKNFPNPIFGIENHYILATEIKKNKIKIFDTTPHKFEGWISKKDFEIAWRGDSENEKLRNVPGIEKLIPFSFTEISISKSIETDEINKISIQLLKNILENFLCGSQNKTRNYSIYFGFFAINELMSRILKDINKKNYERANYFSECLSEIRISRFFFRDFLRDMSKLNNKIIPFFVTEEEIICKLNIAINTFNISIKKKQLNEVRISETVKKIYKYFIQEKNNIKKLSLIIDAMGEG